MPAAYSTPAPGSPAPRSRWRRAGTLALLVLLPPPGLVRVWRAGWSGRGKALAAGYSALWVLALCLALPFRTGGSGSGGDPAAGGQERERNAAASVVPDLVGRSLTQAQDAAVAAHYAAIAHHASDGDAGRLAEGAWTVCFQSPAAGTPAPAGTAIDLAVVREGLPCPAADGAAIPYREVPEVRGEAFARAAADLEDVGLDRVVAGSAYADVPLPAVYGDWIVCFQDPEPGAEVRDPRTTARLSLTDPKLPCPAEEFTVLHPPAEQAGEQEAPGNGSAEGTAGEAEGPGDAWGSRGTWGGVPGDAGGFGGPWSAGGSWGTADSGGLGEGGFRGRDGSAGPWGGAAAGGR